MNRKQLKNFSPQTWLYDLFQLREDVDEEGSILSIKKSVEFQGTNLWALIFAILIASVGLNTNSAAVIIGAMLISPLMGPIMGVGLALGINDLTLLKNSLRSFLISVVIGLFTSTMYFLLTPLGQAQSELLARTRPTIFDVLIAFCGGSIGIIASTRREKNSNAIPGVAIATALMPPLCTAGYGLAKANWNYLIGAFYLFFINSVFICISTIIFVRYLRFHKASFLSPDQEIKVKRILAVFAVATILPSIFAAWEVIQESIFQTRAQKFLSESFNFTETQVIKSEARYSTHGSTIQVILIGQPLSAEQKKLINTRLLNYQLDNTSLELQQPNQKNSQLQEEFKALNQSIRVGIIEDLYKKNELLINQKEEEINKHKNKIKALEKQLKLVKEINYPVQQIFHEMEVSFPALKSLAINKVDQIQASKIQKQTIAFIQWKYFQSENEKQKFNKLLKIRINDQKINIIHY